MLMAGFIAMASPLEDRLDPAHAPAELGVAGPDRAEHGAGLVLDRLAVEKHGALALDDDTAIDQHGVDRGAVLGMDELLYRVVEGNPPGGREVIDDEVGALAHGYRADLVLEQHRLGAAFGRHAQRVARDDPLRA